MLKLKITGSKKQQHGFVGKIFSATNENIQFKIVYFDEEKQVYFRSKIGDFDTIEENFSYTERQIEEDIIKTHWKIIS